jgi:hypothetical protein
MPPIQVPERHDFATAEPAPRLAFAKPPPPRARADTDDTQSVLARLRQLAPATPPTPAEGAERVSSPSLPGLVAARSALASGQVEDARRLMQQAQLQLVFRPMDGPGPDPAAAAKGASDVAHALEALSANDVPRSRRYVEIAIGDVSGTATNLPVQESGMRPSGYAPAYPSR